MAKIKLEELFNILSDKEHQRFYAYLESPYFKCDSYTKRLFKALADNKISFKNYKTDLYKKVFEKEKYNDKEMRYCISNLNKHIENFLILRQIEKDQLLSSQIISKVFTERDCEKSFLLSNQGRGLQSQLKDAPAMLEKYQQAELQLNYFGKKLTANKTPEYSDTLFYLDSFYLLKKLQLSCELTNLSNILQKKTHIYLLDEIKAIASQEPFSKLPSIQIYFHILHFLSDPSDENAFLRSQDLIKTNAHLFKPMEISEIYQYIKNYCVRKINQGNTHYVSILLNIYKDILANKPLMKHEYLSQWEFKNIVSISLRLNEKKWCQNFIEKYINYLKPEERNNALAYNLAYTYFINDEYKKAIRKLQEVELKDVFYQLDARVILLKSYFELDETESFFYQVSSFRLFLLRNTSVSDYQKNIYRNLIKFLAAITRAETSRAKLKKIRTEIEKEKNVADLPWLLKKVEIAIG